MNLKSAERFHNRLGVRVHSQTFQFYSEGLPIAEFIEFKRGVHSFGGKAKRDYPRFQCYWELEHSFLESTANNL